MPKKGQLKIEHINAAVEIYHWIEENKHKCKNGVTNSMMFADAVTDHLDPQHRRFSSMMTQDDPRYNRYLQMIARMRGNGILKLEKERPNGPRVYSVNEKILPPGTVNYTGVRTTIPMAEPKPPQVILPANPTESLKKFHDEGRAFIEEELKNIALDRAVIRRKGVELHLDEPTLYQLYKLGLTLNEVTEPIEDEQDGTEQQDETTTTSVWADEDGEADTSYLPYDFDNRSPY